MKFTIPITVISMFLVACGGAVDPVSGGSSPELLPVVDAGADAAEDAGLALGVDADVDGGTDASPWWHCVLMPLTADGGPAGCAAGYGVIAGENSYDLGAPPECCGNLPASAGLKHRRPPEPVKASRAGVVVSGVRNAG